MAAAASSPSTSSTSSAPGMATSRIRSSELFPSALAGPFQTVTEQANDRASWANAVAGRMCNPIGLATVTVRRSGPLLLILSPRDSPIPPADSRVEELPDFVLRLGRPERPHEVLVPHGV